MILRKTISSVAIATILAVGFTGCMGPKVSSLTTKQVKKEFVRGKTTTDEVRAKYGDPSEENLITWREAKDMFKAKNQSGTSGMGMMGNFIKMAGQSQVNTAVAVQQAKDGNYKQNTNNDDNTEVEYWSYNDYEVEAPSMFNPMGGGKRKGAKLMLVFDGNEILKDYKYQKYSSR